MAEDGPPRRSEFEGYIRRHEADHYAHAPMRHDLRNDLVGDATMVSKRLGDLERWQQRIIGAVSMLSFVVVVAVGAGVVEWLRR